jgi:hypothetical protein
MAATSAASASCWRSRKEGKKRMRQFGKVEIPQSAFLAALKMDAYWALCVKAYPGFALAISAWYCTAIPSEASELRGRDGRAA